MGSSGETAQRPGTHNGEQRQRARDEGWPAGGVAGVDGRRRSLQTARLQRRRECGPLPQVRQAQAQAQAWVVWRGEVTRMERACQAQRLPQRLPQGLIRRPALAKLVSLAVIHQLGLRWQRISRLPMRIPACS